MTSTWYCTDCETEIDAAAIEDHEDRGHAVRGAVRPDRLLGNDPWNLQLEVEGAVSQEGGR